MQRILSSQEISALADPTAVLDLIAGAADEPATAIVVDRPRSLIHMGPCFALAESPATPTVLTAVSTVGGYILRIQSFNTTASMGPLGAVDRVAVAAAEGGVIS